MLGGGGAQTSCAPTHRMPVHPAPPLGAPLQTPLAAPAWAMGGEGGPGPNGQVDGGQEVSALGGPASAGAGGPDSGADGGFPPSAPRPPHLADGGGSSSRSAMPPHAPSSRAAKLSTQERNREAQRRFRERQRTRVSALEAAAAEAAGREGVLRAELTAARARIAELEVALDLQGGPATAGAVLAGFAAGEAAAAAASLSEETMRSGAGGGAAAGGSGGGGGGGGGASSSDCGGGGGPHSRPTSGEAGGDAPRSPSDGGQAVGDAHGTPLASAVAAASAAPTAAAGPTASAAVADALARTLSSTLVLTVDEAGGAVSLTPLQIRGLSVDDVAGFHGAYVARLRLLLAEVDSPAARPAGRAAALAAIERLSAESVSLVFRVLLCNPSTMIELGARSAGAAAPGDGDRLPPAEADLGWLAVGRAMLLSPPQLSALLDLRSRLMAAIAPIRRRRVAAVTALASTLGVRLSGYEHMRQTVSASGAVAELRRSLKEEILVRLSSTNELSMSVLAPVQVARALVAAYPRPPDALAVALWLAADQGEEDALSTLAGFGVDTAAVFGVAQQRGSEGGGAARMAAIAPAGVPVVTSGSAW